MASSLDAYPGWTPELVPVYLAEDTVIEFARRLSGGAGPGITDSISIHH